jgi:hypothetical protein
MKTYNEFIDGIELNENSLRTFGAVAVTAKVNNLYNQIVNIKHLRNETDDNFDNKLFKKLDLIAQQNRNIAVLVAGLDLTNGDKNEKRNG